MISSGALSFEHGHTTIRATLTQSMTTALMPQYKIIFLENIYISNIQDNFGNAGQRILSFL